MEPLGRGYHFQIMQGFMLPHNFGTIWEFPKIRGTLFGGPYNKDPTI